MHTSCSYSYRTRQAATGLLQLIGNPLLEANRNSFKWRAANQYNQLPGEIRKCSSTTSFKMKVKTWIHTNVSMDYVNGDVIKNQAILYNS